MPAFFSKPSRILVDHEITLAEYEAKKVKFNPNDTQHTKLVSDCAHLVRERLNHLQLIDKNMTAGFALGTAAFLLSYILPFSVVSTAAFSYAAYQLAKREQAYVEYTSALENLSKCCIWTLGEVSRNNAHEVKNNLAVQEMIATLAPLTSIQQLSGFIDDGIKEEFIRKAEKLKENITMFDEHLDKEKADLYFKIYGYKQGGFLAILEGMGYAVKTGFASLAAAVASMLPNNSPSPV